MKNMEDRKSVWQNSKPKHGSNFSNQILIGIDKQQSPITIYFPAYLTVKVNKIKSISIGQSIAKMNLTVIYQIYFGTVLSQDIITKICLHLQLGFSRDQPLRLKKHKQQRLKHPQQAQPQQQSDEQQATIQQKKYDIKTGFKRFIINKTFQVNLTPYTIYTPFQIHDLNIYFQLRKIQLKSLQPYKYLQIKQNLMSTNLFHIQSKSKIIDCSRMNSFGYYSLLNNFLIFQNTIKRPEHQLTSLFYRFPLTNTISNYNMGKVLTNQQLVQDKNFQYSSFHIPIYKKPMVSFVTIFLPLWSLSLINLCLFFCQNDYTQRLTAIATLTLAFIPTVQVVRNQIPSTPKVTFVQIAIYSQIFATFLFLVQSYTKRLIINYQFIPLNNIFFIISLLITLFIIIIPLISLILYNIFINKSQQWIGNKKQIKINKSINKKQWDFNLQCQSYFINKQIYLKNFNLLQKQSIKDITQSQKILKIQKKDINKKLKANYCQLITENQDQQIYQKIMKNISEWKIK